MSSPIRLLRSATKDMWSIYPTTRFRIIRARVTLSAIAPNTFGFGVAMSSLASRTAQMIEAAMTIVGANRSLWYCSCSRAIARFISPMRKQHRRT